MIKITYESELKKDVIYDADDFRICSGVPFTRDGLYIQKGGRDVAYIRDILTIEKVEKVEVME